jgi:type VI secretion system secreted protein Hcp
MARVDYFLKLDGIDGESVSRGHEKWIEIESFSWGESNPTSLGTSGGGAGTGKVQMQDFSFVMPFSKASPQLFLKCASGEHIASAVLSASSPEGGRGQDFLKFALTDVLVSSYQTGGASGEEPVPFDQVTLAFAKIEIFYKEILASGEVGDVIHVGWDRLTNSQI